MKILALVSLCVLLAAPAYAGKNANGALIVHTNDTYGYTANICSRFDTVDSPGTCEGAATMTNKPEDQTALVWLIANFCQPSSPGVSVIYFGLNHNLPPGLGYFANFGLCGPAGSIEVPDAGWPDAGGNSVAFGSPVVGDTFFPFYYLNAYGFAGAFLGTGINPTGGYAAFVDDSNPPVQDDVIHFGHVRWGQVGSNDCQGCGILQGACCYPDGSCIVVPPNECFGGVYQGDQTLCDPNPCQQPEACCFCDGHCEDLLVEDCLAREGQPQGPGTTCATGVCLPPPPGACCLPTGDCEVMPGCACEDLGGEFFLGLDCSQIECGSPAEAACCVAGECRVATETDCEASGGVWFPDQPNCNPPFQCPPVATESTTWGRIKADYR